MIIKVCGMRDADNIKAVEQLDIDLMGLVFYPKSPRYVPMVRARSGNMPDYSAERLATLKARLAEGGVAAGSATTGVPRVGVFVDDMPQNIVTRVYNFQLDYVQLHGNEPRTTIDNLRRTLDPDIRPGIRFIKAISIERPEDVDRWREYDGAVDMLLFDTRCPQVGGGGHQFDWSALQRYDGDIPFLLSGGIGPDDADRIRDFHHPRWVGIDLNSRFETAPGVKDVDLLRNFINAIRQ